MIKTSEKIVLFFKNNRIHVEGPSVKAVLNITMEELYKVFYNKEQGTGSLEISIENEVK